jgi:hypothetical protein
MKLTKAMVDVMAQVFGASWHGGGHALVINGSNRHKAAMELARHGFVKITQKEGYHTAFDVVPWNSKSPTP